jgi:hypothetical protein
MATEMPSLHTVLKELKRTLSASPGAVALLLAFLALTGVGGYFACTLNSDLPMSAAGYGAMIAGVIVTLVVGIGLMALIFYSSRRGYDQPPEVERKKEDDSDA